MHTAPFFDMSMRGRADLQIRFSEFPGRQKAMSIKGVTGYIPLLVTLSVSVPYIPTGYYYVYSRPLLYLPAVVAAGPPQLAPLSGDSRNRTLSNRTSS